MFWTWAVTYQQADKIKSQLALAGGNLDPVIQPVG